MDSSNLASILDPRGSGDMVLAAYGPDGRMMGYQHRAAEPETQFQVSVPLTAAVVLGQQAVISSVADRILPPILEPKKTFEYLTYGNEHLQREETSRGPRAPYGHSDFTVTKQSVTTSRHGWSAVADEDAIGNADPTIRFGMKKARWAQRVVQLDLEFEVRDLLVLTGTYDAGNSLTIGAGAEWNDATPGDMLADVQSMMVQICNKIGVQFGDLHAFMPRATLESALANVAFLDRRQHILGATRPNVEELRVYFGLGNLFTENLIGLDTAATSVAALYGDDMIIYYPGDEPRFDTEYGEARFGVRWSQNDGVVREPFFERKNTTWVWPFDRSWFVDVTNNQAGAIIKNTAA